MLDARDIKLLALLQEDAETPLHLLAERVALSASACSRRIARLKSEGYIAKTVAVLDRQRANLPTTLFVMVKAGSHSADWQADFQAAAASIPEIVEVHRLTGSFDYVLKIVLPNVEHYDLVYKRLTAKVALSEVVAFISMETVKAETGLPTSFI